MCKLFTPFMYISCQKDFFELLKKYLLTYIDGRSFNLRLCQLLSQALVFKCSLYKDALFFNIFLQSWLIMKANNLMRNRIKLR